jgi:hypothetical protein
MLWEIDGLDSKPVDLYLVVMEHTLKGFRSKTFFSPALGGYWFLRTGASKEGR